MTRGKVSQRRRQSRGGFAAIMVIVIFGVAMALCGSWLRTAAGDARRQRLSEERVQAYWLAEAGVRRGAALWLADGGFAGEEWTVPAEELGRQDAGCVEVRVERVGADDNNVRIVARARYPKETPRVRVAKTVTFSRPSAGSEP